MQALFQENIAEKENIASHSEVSPFQNEMSSNSKQQNISTINVELQDQTNYNEQEQQQILEEQLRQAIMSYEDKLAEERTQQNVSQIPSEVSAMKRLSSYDKTEKVINYILD